MSVIGSLRTVMGLIVSIVAHENREHNGLPAQLADTFDALTTAVETMKKERGLLGAVRVTQAIALRVQAYKFYHDLLALPTAR